ncbi:MAG: FlgD immunoglobulin-like domain containing protein [Candidatus Eisenbacteria bacterium]
MAYAGICGADNLQAHSDPYFHIGSFVQIRAFTETGNGSSCPVTTVTGNAPPISDASQGTNWVIPKGTYFELTGSATDADGDDLTYCWEEYDLGPGGSPNNPSGNAPIFRSFNPVTTPSRSFPRWTDIVNGTQTQGEILPSYARNLRFRLTVRDGLGGVNWDEAELITVADSGPLQVTYPNALGITWTGGTNETVTWAVNGTNGAPVNATNVDILLSVDGGFTYPYLLLAGTPNDGSQSITVPPVPTTTARIRVGGSNNVFFDISNRNFTIEADPTSVPESGVVGKEMLIGNEPNPFSNITHVRFQLDEPTPVKLRIYDPSGRVIATLADGVLEAGTHTQSWDGTDTDNRRVPAGVYFYRLEAGNRIESKQLVLTN